ncbi:MAG: DUF4238 domain-containing protein [Candidatus Helarchaeota archaeon]
MIKIEKKMNYKHFSLNLFYIKNDTNFIIYNRNKIRLGTFTQNFDEENKIFHLTNYQFDKIIIGYMQELLYFQIFIAIIIQAEKLIIEGFPLTSKLIKPVLSLYKQNYGEEKINIQQFKEESPNEKCNLTIIIKQPKRTHFIQQAYLRNFSSNTAEWFFKNKKNKARIFVFDKIKGELINIGNTTSEKRFGQKINNVAKEDFYYSLALEDFMANTLEKEIPEIINIIRTEKSVRNLTRAQKETLVKYILLIWSRSPEAREHLKEGLEKGTEMGIEYFSEFKIPENYKAVINHNLLQIGHEKYIINLINPPNYDDSLVKHLMSFYFGVIETRKPLYFITSDNPIIFYNSYYESQKKKGKDFIKTKEQEALAIIKKNKRVASVIISTSDHPERAPRVKGVEIYFPLTPKICLFLINKQRGSKLLTVKDIIKETVLQANHFIYSHKSDFTFIKQIIKENPQTKKRKGKRIKVKGFKLNPKGKGEPKLKALCIEDIIKKDDFLQ